MAHILFPALEVRGGQGGDHEPARLVLGRTREAAPGRSLLVAGLPNLRTAPEEEGAKIKDICCGRHGVPVNRLGDWEKVPLVLKQGSRCVLNALRQRRAPRDLHPRRPGS